MKPLSVMTIEIHDICQYYYCTLKPEAVNCWSLDLRPTTRMVLCLILGEASSFFSFSPPFWPPFFSPPFFFSLSYTYIIYLSTEVEKQVTTWGGGGGCETKPWIVDDRVLGISCSYTHT